MNKELEKKLNEYAEKRADKVFDIDIYQLRQLVIDGAKWMSENNITSCEQMRSLVEGAAEMTFDNDESRSGFIRGANFILNMIKKYLK